MARCQSTYAHLLHDGMDSSLCSGRLCVCVCVSSTFEVTNMDYASDAQAPREQPASF